MINFERVQYVKMSILANDVSYFLCDNDDPYYYTIRVAFFYCYRYSKIPLWHDSFYEMTFEKC